MKGADIAIPIRIGRDQYAEVGINTTSEIGEQLSDEELLSALRENTDLDGIALDLQRLSGAKEV